jgi:hypothetical protein
MGDGELIVRSLDAFAERVGDPAPLIYARLFAAHPELERLFAMDRDGGVRASMVETCFVSMLDHAEGGATGRAVVAASRLHHEGYGVPEGMFGRFFAIIRDEARRALGDDWSMETEAAWARMIEAFGAG